MIASENPALRQPSRRLYMGVRVEPKVGEPIWFTLRRFQKAIQEDGNHYEQQRHVARIKPCERRRFKRLQAKRMARMAAFLLRNSFRHIKIQPVFDI